MHRKPFGTDFGVRALWLPPAVGGTRPNCCCSASPAPHHPPPSARALRRDVDTVLRFDDADRNHT
ncbi:hypothetical protein [Streptomyces sp. NPDC048349]|uniref:hypothetical protein n=1 Tax=Streptomyces sp. NPDC048349 TaxID=3155486 RepID=UPI00342B035A